MTRIWFGAIGWRNQHFMRVILSEVKDLTQAD
jgi:hypothetical protein